jgi:hypothetical protein
LGAGAFGGGVEGFGEENKTMSGNRERREWWGDLVWNVALVLFALAVFAAIGSLLWIAEAWGPIVTQP